MKLLIIRPIGGIANRMRVIESAYNFSAATSLKLIVIWERNENLNARYKECFKSVDGIKVIDVNMHGDSLIAKANRRLLNTLIAGFLKLYTNKSITDWEIERKLVEHRFNLPALKSHFDEYAQAGKGIYIETCWEFYENVSNFQLQIAKSIREKSAGLLKNTAAITGVHIRRGDNVQAIEKSPLYAFIEEIECTIKVKPQARFYLSTDSEEVTHTLKTMFPANIITGALVRNRDSKAGIISALVDLTCLSMCNEIWGSHDSSFSDRAARIRNIPLKIISQYAE